MKCSRYVPLPDRSDSSTNRGSRRAGGLTSGREGNGRWTSCVSPCRYARQQNEHESENAERRAGLDYERGVGADGSGPEIGDAEADDARLAVAMSRAIERVRD